MAKKMNKKEALNILRKMSACNDKEAEALDVAVKTIEESLLCRWHYIDANPEDLPEEGKEIVYIFSYPGKGNSRIRCTNTHIYTGPDFFEEHDGFRYLAWKYIEKSYYRK